MTSFQNIFEGHLLHVLTARLLKLMRDSKWHRPEESLLSFGWWNAHIGMTTSILSLRDQDVLDFRQCTVSRFYQVEEGE
ncbi:hypothetical protein FSHL1_012126 [Fusarium sambucinum]